MHIAQLAFVVLLGIPQTHCEACEQSQILGLQFAASDLLQASMQATQASGQLRLSYMSS